MSYCKKEGKDKIIFATEEDHKVPSKIPFPEEDEDDKPVGLVLPNGEINWGCPCLGGMATGPCGVEFREAFGCFHFSKAEPKGSDCLQTFRTMSECMSQYPGVYGGKDDAMDEDDNESFMSKDSSIESRNGNGNAHTEDSGNNSSNTSSLVSSSNHSNVEKKSS